MNLNKKIGDLQNKILNYAFTICTFLAVISHTLAFIRNASYGANIAFIIQSVVVSILIIISIFRTRIPNSIKIYALVIAVWAAISSGLFAYGILASGKVYIVALPAFLVFLFNFQKSLMILIFLTVNYAVFAFLYISGRLSYDFDITNFVTDPSIWIMDVGIIFLSALGLQYIGYLFKQNVVSGFAKIESQNLELKESEEKYKKLVSAFPDIIMVSDLKGNIIYGNENLAIITGITEKDYTDLSRKARIHPDDLDKIKASLIDLINSDKHQTPIIENRFITTWGDTLWFSGTMSKLNINEQMYIQTVSRDITEKKKIEIELDNYRKNLEKLVKEKTEDLERKNQELETINQQLSAKNELVRKQYQKLKTTLQNLKSAQTQLLQAEKMASLGILTAGVAHEINNPLNFIMGAYSGLKKMLTTHGNNNEQIDFLLSSLKTGVERATGIVRSLNQFSRDSEDKNEDSDINMVLENCLMMLQSEINHKIKLEKNLTSDQVIIKGNTGQLHQVFLNLLHNAIQAIVDKGEIEISTHVVDKNLMVDIKDDGEGISKENLPKITDPFFTTKPPGKGTGLGLAISYNIIKEHNGWIEFDSEVGKGTAVRVFLPLYPTL